MKHIIILNGPPGSGKDACASYLHDKYGFVLDRFSAPLKAAIPALLGESFEDLEASKDEPSDMIPWGWTFRDCQISMSEDWLKKIAGGGIFGCLLGRRLEQSLLSHYVIPDSGFMEELEALVYYMKLISGELDYRILFIRLIRPGHNFDRDSRNYLYLSAVNRLPGVTASCVFNTGTLPDLYSEIDSKLTTFFTPATAPSPIAPGAP